jgi:hypothetical protein
MTATTVQQGGRQAGAQRARVKRLIFLAVLLWPSVVRAVPCEKYGLKPVAGTVHRTMFYGPPNFGENPKTDERGFYPVLQLDRPLHMCADHDETVSADPVTSREMQMIFIPPHVTKPWYGKHVAAIGKLFPWNTGWHHTPVMLMVKDIKEAP